MYFYRKFVKPFLPLNIRRRITNFKFSNYYLKSYSQFGEDLLIHNFFKHTHNFNKKYLDIGCFHPKMISNTHLLHLNGWKGLVVDTSEYKLNLFKKSRKKSVDVLNAAVVSNQEQNKYLDFYFFDIPFSEIDTLSYEFAIEKREEREIDFKVEQINTIRINELLTKDDFDFLNIDIEGMDETIINSIDFSTINKPKLICFEKHNPLKSKISVDNLENNGYKHLFTTGPSVGYYLQ